jgi:hypothetical protein
MSASVYISSFLAAAKLIFLGDAILADLVLFCFVEAFETLEQMILLPFTII